MTRVDASREPRIARQQDVTRAELALLPSVRIVGTEKFHRRYPGPVIEMSLPGGGFRRFRVAQRQWVNNWPVRLMEVEGQSELDPDPVRTVKPAVRRRGDLATHQGKIEVLES